MIPIKIINKSEHELPSYQTTASAGMDLRANNEDPIMLKPLERAIIPTGIYIELPVGYGLRFVQEADWQPRKASLWSIAREP